jgi:flotillin
LAEAAIIEAQGRATADAMRNKAESFKQYNEAAVIEMIIRVLPEVAGKISEPLARTEKMVIINSGNGPGGGASKLTGDVTQIVAQLPPVIESLTGIQLEKLIQQVPSLRQATRSTEQKTGGGEPGQPTAS